MNKTAVLVFSRTSTEESAVKTFDVHIGKKGNTAIAQQLIQHSIGTARKSKLPVFTSFSSSQSGKDFGEKLANSIEGVFAKGFDSVIAIGNDSPTLTPELLQYTAARLEQEDLVLGPAADGGVYLIGIHRRAYNKDQFIQLPWESSQLIQGWREYSSDLPSKQQQIIWLAVSQDIDNAFDFSTFLRSLDPWEALYQAFISILASAQPSVGLPVLVAARQSRHISLRAPPY